MDGTRLAEIASAAEMLFGRQGYHATTVRQVAGAVNLQGGSLYAHFGSKEELLARVVDRASEAFHDAVEPVLTGPGSAPERLAAALEAHIHVVAANPLAATVYFQDWRHLSGRLLDQARQRRDAYETLWRQTVADGVAAGELAPVDPQLAAVAWLSVGNWVHQWYRPQGRLSPAAIAQVFSAVLLNGLDTRGSMVPSGNEAGTNRSSQSESRR